MNLLTETLEIMNHHGLTEDDVLYVNVPLEYFSDELESSLQKITISLLNSSRVLLT